MFLKFLCYIYFFVGGRDRFIWLEREEEFVIIGYNFLLGKVKLLKWLFLFIVYDILSVELKYFVFIFVYYELMFLIRFEGFFLEVGLEFKLVKI